jgi:hypothetical protein
LADDRIPLLPWGPKALDDWLARTEDWSHSLSAAAGLPLHRRVLLQMLEAFAGRYVGEELEVRTDTSHVHFALDAIEITPAGAAPSPVPSAFDAPLIDLARDLFSIVPGARQVTRMVEQSVQQFADRVERLRDPGRVCLDAHAVRLPDGVLDRVGCVVSDLRLEPGRVPTLASGRIEMVVQVARPTMAAWIERAQPGTVVRVDGDRITVRPTDRKFTFTVEPSVVGSELQARVVRVRRGRIDLGLPKRFVRTYSVPIPAPDPLVVIDAVLHDDLVVRYHHPGIRHLVHPDRVRELVAQGSRRFSLADLTRR